jgi:hypothetical protein
MILPFSVNVTIISQSPGTTPQKQPSFFLFLNPNSAPNSSLPPSGQMLFTFVISFSYPMPFARLISNLGHWHFLHAFLEHPNHYYLINFQSMSESTEDIM